MAPIKSKGPRNEITFVSMDDFGLWLNAYVSTHHHSFFGYSQAADFFKQKNTTAEAVLARYPNVIFPCPPDLSLDRLYGGSCLEIHRRLDKHEGPNSSDVFGPVTSREIAHLHSVTITINNSASGSHSCSDREEELVNFILDNSAVSDNVNKGGSNTGPQLYLISGFVQRTGLTNNRKLPVHFYRRPSRNPLAPT